LLTSDQRTVQGLRPRNKRGSAGRLLAAALLGAPLPAEGAAELGLKILEALADYLLSAVEALKSRHDYLKEHPARHIEKNRPLSISRPNLPSLGGPERA
jgi:hypothetical protein